MLDGLMKPVMESMRPMVESAKNQELGSLALTAQALIVYGSTPQRATGHGLLELVARRVREELLLEPKEVNPKP